MIKDLLGRLVLSALSTDDPIIDVTYEQSEMEGVWRATFSLTGSNREWKTTVGMKSNLESALDPELPPEFTRTEFNYVTPYMLKSGKPVDIVIKSKNLAAVSGMVCVSFEAKAGMGGTSIPRWVPIGFADPELLARYEASAVRNKILRAPAHDG